MARRKGILMTACIAVASSTALIIAFPSPTHTAVQTKGEALTREQAKMLTSPISFTKESITKGRTLFARYCTECHGSDGKSQVDVIANATDLTEPKLYRSGTTEGEIFRSIRDGAGESMPPFKSQISKEEDIWHMVNFIRSLWPEEMRPKLQQ
jgi:mono/diheme cytochrome c family protein